MENNSNVTKDNQNYNNNCNEENQSSEIRRPDKVSEPDQESSNNNRAIVISADKVTDLISDVAKVYGVCRDSRAREHISNNDLRRAEIENARKTEEIKARREQHIDESQIRREELALEEKKILNETETKKLDIISHKEIEITKINAEVTWERKILNLEIALERRDDKIIAQNIVIEQLEKNLNSQKKELDSLKTDLENERKKNEELIKLNNQTNLSVASQVPANYINASNPLTYRHENNIQPNPHNFYFMQNPSMQPTHLKQPFPIGQHMPNQSGLNITPQYNHLQNNYSQIPQQVLPNYNGDFMSTQLSSNRYHHFAPPNNFTAHHSNNVDTPEVELKVNTTNSK